MEFTNVVEFFTGLGLKAYSTALLHDIVTIIAHIIRFFRENQMTTPMALICSKKREGSEKIA